MSVNKSKGLSIAEIQKKNLCRTCDPSICHNDYRLCPYQYEANIKLCLLCKDLNNEIVDGVLKCFHTCKYRYKSQKKMDKWFS